MANGGYFNILRERWVTRANADKASGVSTIVRARFFPAVGGVTHYSLNLAPASLSIAASPTTSVASRVLNLGPASLSLSLSPATSVANRSINLGSASFAFPLSATASRVDRILSLATTSYNLSGYVATLTAEYKLNLAPTSLTIAASPVTSQVAKGMNLEPAAYAYSIDFTLTGYPITFIYVGQAAVNLEPATFSLSGSPQEYAIGYAFSLGSSSYSVSGSPIEFGRTNAYTLNLEPAVETLTYFFAAFYRTYVYDNSPTIYDIAGSPATLSIGRSLLADSASFSLIGFPSTSYLGKVVNLEAGFFLIEGPDFLMSKNTRYPPEALVVDGTIYGDAAQFLGSYKVPKLVYDLDTGRFVKILSNKTGLSL